MERSCYSMISYSDMLDTLEKNDSQETIVAEKKGGDNKPEKKGGDNEPEKKGGDNEPENKDCEQEKETDEPEDVI